MIDDCYLPENGDVSDVRYNNQEFLTKSQWLALFAENKLGLVNEDLADEIYNIMISNDTLRHHSVADVKGLGLLGV